MKKIIDYSKCEKKPCSYSGHNPPNMIVLPPGVYEHTCSKCGEKQTVIIDIKLSL